MERRNWLTTSLSLLGGLGVGAAVMYLLDPDQGEQRRSMLRETAARGLGAAGETLGSTFGSARDAIGSTIGRLSERAGDVAQNAANLAHDLAERSTGTASDTSRTMLQRSKAYLSDYVEEGGYSTNQLLLTAIGCCAAGALLMFILDPEQGRRRRALVTNKAYSAVKRSGRAIEKKARHTANVAKGIYHEARSAVGGSESETSSQIAPNPIM